MYLANVMVYVDPQQQDEGQIRVAEGIADRFHASLIGVSAVAVDPPFVAEGVIIEQTTKDDIRRMRADLAAKGEWFRKVVGRDRHQVEWRWGLKSPTEFLSEQARVADLIVFKRQKVHSDNFPYLDSAEAILRMGRPTLSVPESVTSLSADRIVVGWKDAREARLAIRDALPLLTHASKVTVAEICTSDEQDAATRRLRDVASYLERHGVNCRFDVRVHTAESDAEYLVRLAGNEGADLIVAGGYGHRRLGYWMFGGMTRGLLQHAPICLLMSH
ncbi:universal stress protein [Bradyrhizobium mercantei]|uniref:universal stress protein n=1 Tax=Bradyrhizobium mercantei TaxID=1904807 RepID=UPI000976E554|nr:universal stress protein [Bradyrhizobium mercantei]